MKSPVAYYLVLIYVTVILHPVLPILSDVWSHAFSETYHLSTVHKLYGSHHLDIDLSKDGSHSGNKKESLKYNESISLHMSNLEEDNINLLCKTLQHITVKSILFTLPLPTDKRPPKFSC